MKLEKFISEKKTKKKTNYYLYKNEPFLRVFLCHGLDVLLTDPSVSHLWYYVLQNVCITMTPILHLYKSGDKGRENV